MLLHHFLLRNAVNMLFLEFSSKKGFYLTIPSIPVSLNQYRGEIGSFYNRSTSQITELTISLYFSNFYQKCFGLYCLDSKYEFFNASRSMFIL